MQVNTGQNKGRQIKYPDSIRPMTQKDKKILIDTLRFDLANAHVLDLYAGSGQIGIEILSNGSAHVTFVENNRTNSEIIQENLANANIDSSRYKIAEKSVKSFLHIASLKYDIIVIDPPHFQVIWKDLENISQVSHSNTILVIKHDKNNPPPDFPGFILKKTKGSKDNLMNFYLKK